MLAATVRATGDVEFQILIKSGQALIEFLHQPPREAFGFSDREFAELVPEHATTPRKKGEPATGNSMAASSFARASVFSLGR